MRHEEGVLLDVLVKHVRPLMHNLVFTDPFGGRWAPRAVDIEDKASAALGIMSIRKGILILDLIQVLPDELSDEGVLEYNISNPDLLEMLVSRLHLLDIHVGEGPERLIKNHV